MNKILTLVSFAYLITGCGSLQSKSKGHFENKQEYIAVVLNDNWNNDSINYYENYFAQFNIEFKVDDVVYTRDALLNAASIEVNCRDGYSGSASGSGKNINTLGFVRDYGKKSKLQFVVGVNIQKYWPVSR